MNPIQSEIVALRGISLIEFDVLYAVHLHPQLTRAGVAAYAVAMSAATPEEGSQQSEYEPAVEACFQNGWLKILTDEDCEQDRLRWQNDLNQHDGEWEYRTGDVKLTEEGARLFYGILVEIEISEGHKPYHRNIGYSWSLPGQVRVFGAYEDEVKRNVEAILTGEEPLGIEACDIERVEGPFATGPWWINRFVQLPQGYRVDIYYRSDGSGDND